MTGATPALRQHYGRCAASVVAATASPRPPARPGAAGGGNCGAAPSSSSSRYSVVVVCVSWRQWLPADLSPSPLSPSPFLELRSRRTVVATRHHQTGTTGYRDLPPPPASLPQPTNHPTSERARPTAKPRFIERAPSAYHSRPTQPIQPTWQGLYGIIHSLFFSLSLPPYKHF